MTSSLPTSTMISACEFTSSKLVKVMPAASHRLPFFSCTQGGSWSVVERIVLRTSSGGAFGPPSRPGSGTPRSAGPATNGKAATSSMVGSGDRRVVAEAQRQAGHEERRRTAEVVGDIAEDEHRVEARLVAVVAERMHGELAGADHQSAFELDAGSAGWLRLTNSPATSAAARCMRCPARSG